MTNKKNILIVEDDKEMVTIYKDVLSDYKLVLVGNTADAEKKLNSHKVDLMILDVILPNESGDVFFERIKSQSKFKDLKTLVITVLGNEYEFFGKIDPKVQCLAKPFDKQKLLMFVQNMLETKKAKTKSTSKKKVSRVKKKK